MDDREDGFSESDNYGSSNHRQTPMGSYDNENSRDSLGGGYSGSGGGASGGWQTVEPGVAHSFTQRNGMAVLDDGEADSDFDEVFPYFPLFPLHTIVCLTPMTLLG